MKRLHQELDTSNDSFSYTVVGEKEPLYFVDSNATLFSKGVEIGKFRLVSTSQWELLIDDVVVATGPENGLFMLPEFELKALTALVNQ